jgi:hypothetical protein
MDFVEPWRHHEEAGVERIAKAVWLAILVGTPPWSWWTLACLPSRGSLRPHVRLMTSWRGVGTVLECMRLQPRSLGLGVTFSSVVLLLFSSIFLLYVNI